MFTTILSHLTCLVLGAFVSWFICVFASGLPTGKADSPEERRKTKLNIRNCTSDGILIEESWGQNGRGMLLYRQVFLPCNAKIRAVIGVCHGFGDNTLSFPTDFAHLMCKEGYAVIMQDVEGHGLSDGLHGYLPSMEHVVEDFYMFYKNQMSTPRFLGLPFIVYGESMGGAINFEVCLMDTNQELINGAVFMCPMLKITDEMKPHQIIINILLFLSKFFPKAAMTPKRDLDELCFRREDMKLRAKNNTLGYKKNVRLGTAVSFLHITDKISKSFSKFSHPALIMHGDGDRVTSVEVSKEFYKSCSSTDKQIKTYPSTYHQLIFGEYPQIANQVLADLLQWLRAHT